MKKKYLITFLYAFTLYANLPAQSNTIQISIAPTFDGEIIQLADSAFIGNDAGDLQIEVLKFYISDFQFYKEGNLVLREQNSYHLIDAADMKTWNLSIENLQEVGFDEVRFNLGIDSNTNAGGVLGGDLDPTKGMYWTWQSGYINFKLEGKSPECITRKNAFTFHLGGFLAPNYALQSLSFRVDDPQQINLHLDVAQIMQGIDLKTQNHIMSPSLDAVNLSRIVAASFKISGR